MRISDWSSDVCSSDLHCDHGIARADAEAAQRDDQGIGAAGHRHRMAAAAPGGELGLESGNLFAADIPAAVEYALDRRVDRQLLFQVGRFRIGLRDHAAELTDNVRRRSEEHTSELQSLMRISYAVFCLKKKKTR